jgi:hypothetical protein
MGNSWSQEEFATVDLGDKRLNSRLIDIAEAFSNYPTASIPQATIDWKRTKGSYRFFDNQKVKPGKILQAHKEASAKRIHKHEKTKRLFAIQDTTEIGYASHIGLELGYGTHPSGNSLFLHATLISSEENIPLGLIDQQVWVRKEMGVSHKRREKRIEEKESFKWLKSLRETSIFQQKHRQTHFVSICDREGDIYDLFAETKTQQLSSNIDILVRSAWNRRLENEDYNLAEYTKQLSCVGKHVIKIPRNGRRKEREAKLEVCYAKIKIKPPLNRIKNENLVPLELYVVEAKEKATKNNANIIQWRLLTTYKVDSFESAKLMLKWYSKRWLIEEYFRVLKSGCAIEERQLRTSDRLENCLAIDAIIAWRILFLMYIGRKIPDLPASILFNETEWTVLYGFIHKTPKPPPKEPSIQDMMKWLAKLGGFLGRKNDGHPGAEVLWRGSWKLPDIIATWLIFKQ